MESNEVLLERVRNGDKAAADKLVEDNIGLVRSVVKRFIGRGYDADDLFQIGSIGLIKAVRKFDPSFGVMFSTYAVPMIMGEIRRFLRDDGAVKVSRSLKEKAAKGKKYEELLRKELGREPTISEISHRSGISSEELVEAFSAMTPPESIYAESQENENIRKIDRLGTVSHEEEIVNHVMLQNILNRLEPRERQIILLRYFKGKTQSETARVFGVSQVQISRIERNTLNKIRKMAE